MTYISNNFKKLDMAINCVGIEGPMSSIHKVNVDDFDKVMKVNTR